MKSTFTSKEKTANLSRRRWNNRTQRFNAIRFDDRRGETELARKVRKLAMERGGIVMVEIPEIETLHDADGYMRQYLPNDVLLEFSREDGGCDVFHKGMKVRHYENVLVRDIPEIQIGHRL